MRWEGVVSKLSLKDAAAAPCRPMHVCHKPSKFSFEERVFKGFPACSRRAGPTPNPLLPKYQMYVARRKGGQGDGVAMPHRTTLLSLPQGTAPLWCFRRLTSCGPISNRPVGSLVELGHCVCVCVCVHVGERKAGNTLVLVKIYKCCSIPKVSQLCYCSEYVGIFAIQSSKLPNPSKHHRMPGIACKTINHAHFPDQAKSIKHKRH